MRKIRTIARVTAVALAIALGAAACGSDSIASSGAGDRDAGEASTESQLFAIAEAAITDLNIEGSFYEFTLLQYQSGADDDYDHAAVLPDGAELVYSAEVERQLQGDTEWDWTEVVLYDDKATYLETLASPEYAEAEAARAEVIADTHVSLAEPITPITGEPLVAGQEPRSNVVPQPTDPDDPPFMLVAAVEVVDQEALEAHYASAAGDGDPGAQGAALGIGPVMWMDVTVPLVGDDSINSIRFNYWPSHSIFSSIQSGSPDLSNREEGLGEASTMMTLPEVDRFTPTTGDGAPESPTNGEVAALYTPAAVGFLDATVGFTACLDAEGQPWMGEPDPGDPDVDPEYLAALGACGSDVSITDSLEALFVEDPDAQPVTDIPEDYRSEDAVAALVAIGGFTSCLTDAGFEWMGVPGASDADAPRSYGTALADCQASNNVQAALDRLLD